jgi:hypothetical protein
MYVLPLYIPQIQGNLQIPQPLPNDQLDFYQFTPQYPEADAQRFSETALETLPHHLFETRAILLFCKLADSLRDCLHLCREHFEDGVLSFYYELYC